MLTTFFYSSGRLQCRDADQGTAGSRHEPDQCPRKHRGCTGTAGLSCTGQAPFKKSPIRARVWIWDLIFGNFWGTFWRILADSGASGPQKSIPDDPTDLGTHNESSGACLRPNFGQFRQTFERFLKKSNFEIKKSAIQSLNFLSGSFLSGS